MHPFDLFIAPDRAVRDAALSYWSLVTKDDPYTAELLYLTCIRPTAEVRTQVLADYERHVASFGPDDPTPALSRPAWDVDIVEFMEDSDWALSEPTRAWEIALTVNDEFGTKHPALLFAQAVTPAHTALLYHQPTVQLTPIFAGIVPNETMLRSTAFRLSRIPQPLFHVDDLWTCQADLPPLDLARLAYASSKLDVPFVLRCNAEGMRLLLRQDFNYDPP
jgi:hypothetical protein